MTLKKIIILGGGTAGWLTANHLAKKLNAELGQNVSITVIASDTIPTIGVGEGTVPYIKETLQYFGISEEAIITEAEGTYKQGIKFQNWSEDPIKRGEHAYYHPFEPFPLGQESIIRSWLQEPDKVNFEDYISIQARLAENNLAPKLITHGNYQSFVDYAFHFDAGKFTKLLSNNAITQFGVEAKNAVINRVELNPDGSIHSLVSENEVFEADFFVDCSGFQSDLLSGTLGVGFNDLSDTLLTDKALVTQIPYPQSPEKYDINPYTKAVAQSCGWIWDIQLQTRKGVGLVYSSSHSSIDEAHTLLSDYTGIDKDILNARQIDMKVGYRKQFWKKNCAAIGLSQGFVEPLEATGLLVFDMTASMLSYALAGGGDVLTQSAAKFNRDVETVWLNIVDFIKLHYCISKRRDSEFWIDNCENSKIPDSLSEKLEMWRFRAPNKFDFTSKLNVFTISNYQYVLYGMKHFPEALVNPSPFSNSVYQEMLKSKTMEYEYWADKAQLHSELIDKIIKFGVSKG
ncbi:FADH2 O2-dependent halogenase I [Pseudoalteromonas citrea]|uniref:FADH2 O2-dependent halogenase I n=2 Tax=Pseudoalteromonas citrea TaxID=43655 RepID=A0AAD4AKT4_9GAMM|nr:tryptophan halogenase family protein [Pseudoalteromonas citrea]KAF7773984.1 FADH2 O2-dependent halogenase I [Pseudoalteromonas citrea]